MKKAKILVVLGALLSIVAIVSGAFASRAKMLHIFFSQITRTSPCIITYQATLTLSKDAPTNFKFTTKLSTIATLNPCPTITVATIN